MHNIVLTEKTTLSNRIKSFFLYQKAFPREEKKPFWLIRKAEKLGYGRNFLIENEKGEFLGLAFTISNGDYVLLDYLAIEMKHRGHGIGTQVLKKLKSLFHPLPLVLEIEDPDSICDNREERIKRAEFYKKCGMHTMDYRICLFGVDMKILTSGEDVSFERYHSLLYQVFGEQFAKNIALLK